MRTLSWALAAGPALWALLRLGGLDRTHPLVALVSFTPHATVAAVAVVLLLAALRRWRPLALAAAATLLLVAGLAPRAVGGGEDPNGPRLRVLSANVAFGRVEAEALVDLARRHRVDVLSVQELTPEFDARLRRAGIGDLLPRAVTAPVAGALGTGLYARLPLREAEAPGGSPFEQVAASTRWHTAGEFELVSVHAPPPVSGAHVAQWHDALRALAARDRQPRLLIGDFNATLDHRAMRELLASGYRDAAETAGDGLSATWRPGPLRPGLAIDHVLHTEPFVAVRTGVLPLPRSDHRALYVELGRAADE